MLICLEDPFGAGLPVYTVERTCLESPQVSVDCKAHWVVLNASAYEAVRDNEGLTEGITRYESLVSALLDAGRHDDLRRAAADPTYRDALFVELGIA